MPENWANEFFAEKIDRIIIKRKMFLFLKFMIRVFAA